MPYLDELAVNNELRTPTNRHTPDFFNDRRKQQNNAPTKAPRPETPDSNPSFNPRRRLF